MPNGESAAMQNRAAPSPPRLPTLSPMAPDQTTVLPLPLNPSSPIPKADPSSILLPAHPLASSRYQRQALLPSISIRGQTAISAARVLIIGLGGLGSPASLYLAALGVHTLGLVDGDTVELSNLHRQIVHKESTVGTSKVRSAMGTLKELNSEVKLVAFEERFSTVNARRIVDEWRDDDNDDGRGRGEGGGRGWDIVLDCTDNPATRYLISDACVLAGKVLVSGAAQRTEGQLMVLNYPARQVPLKDATGTAGMDGIADVRDVKEKGPCYRCVFPVPPAPETVQSCAEVGVLGPVVGVIGVLMAMEVVKIVVAVARDEDRRAWKPSLLLYNGLSNDARAVWRSVGLRGRRRDCVACGDEEVLKEKGKWEDGRITWGALAEGRMDYEEFCGRVEDVRVLGEGNRVPAAQFLKSMEREEAQDWLVGRDRERPLVVDVREEAEFALGPKVRGSINVPISRILRHGGQGATEEDEGIDQLLGPGESTNKHPIFFLCQRGNDSQIAAQQFLGRVGRNRWVGDVKDGLQALERQVHG
jgi:adenylyltransferase and sulfurtransferase